MPGTVFLVPFGKVHRLYKMGIGVRRKDFTTIETPTLSLVSASRKEITEKAIEVKRHNMGKSQVEMTDWLRGPAGKDFLIYLKPVSVDEFDRYRMHRNETI